VQPPLGQPAALPHAPAEGFLLTLPSHGPRVPEPAWGAASARRAPRGSGALAGDEAWRAGCWGCGVASMAAWRLPAEAGKPPSRPRPHPRPHPTEGIVSWLHQDASRPAPCLTHILAGWEGAGREPRLRHPREAAPVGTPPRPGPPPPHPRGAPSEPAPPDGSPPPAGHPQSSRFREPAGASGRSQRSRGRAAAERGVCTK